MAFPVSGERAKTRSGRGQVTIHHAIGEPVIGLRSYGVSSWDRCATSETRSSELRRVRGGHISQFAAVSAQKAAGNNY